MAGMGRQRRDKGPRLAVRAAFFGLCLAVAGLLAIQSSPQIRGAFDDARGSADDASVRLVADPTSGLDFFGANRAARERIAELEAEVRALSYWRDNAEAMAERLARYERMLDFVGEAPSRGKTARIVAEADGPFGATRIANAGRLHGVEEGYSAVNENGLVGRVIRTGGRTSRILLVTDYSSRIPVMGMTSQDRALLVGDRAKGARLLHAETPKAIVPGEDWVTSGDDGVFPRGLQVGRARRDGDIWRLDLAMNEGAVDFVRLIPPPEFLTPEVDPAPEAQLQNTLSPNSPEGLVSQAPNEEGSAQDG